jgi:hypothetical protein
MVERGRIPCKTRKGFAAIYRVPAGPMRRVYFRPCIDALKKGVCVCSDHSGSRMCLHDVSLCVKYNGTMTYKRSIHIDSQRQLMY